MKRILVALLAGTLTISPLAAQQPVIPEFNTQAVGNAPKYAEQQNALTGSISATAGVVTITTNGASTVGLSITGTWSGALAIKASVDASLVGVPNATFGVSTAVSLTSGNILTAITANGLYQINAGGFSAIQIYGTNIASGTANIAMISGPGVSTVMADNPIPVSPSGTWAVSGYDSGARVGTGTVNGSSHAAGTSVGGLITVPVVRTVGGSGIITNFLWTSPGGSTGQLVVRIWQKNPASTTCTDQTAYAGNATDDAQLITPPFSITPSTPAVTTGDSKTYGSVAGVTWDYANQSANTNLYLCAVTVATDTADENTTVSAMLSGPQN